MNKAFVLFLGVAAVGAAAFFLIPAPESERSDVVIERGGDGAPMAQGRAQGVDELEGVASTGEGAGRAVGTTDSAALRDVTQNEGEGDAAGEPTHARCFGIVTDVYGGPIAGAEVVLRRAGLEDLWDAKPAEDALQSRTTDADGAFEFQARPGKLEILAGADGYAPLVQTFEAVAGEPQDLRELRLAQGVTLAGRVVDSEGAGVAGAKLVPKPVQRGGLTIIGRSDNVAATTDAAGGFEILRQGAGPFHFFVRHDDHPSADLQGRTERPGESLIGLEVMLPAGAELRGTVTGVPPGTSGLKVVAIADDRDVFSMTAGGLGERLTGVAEDGTFRLRGIVPGQKVRVGLVAGRYSWGGETRRSEWVWVNCPVDRVPDPVQLTYSEGATVTFRTVDADGKPMLPASVEAGFDYAQDRRNLDQDEETGATTIDGLWPDAEGEVLELELRSKGYANWSADNVKIYPGEAVDLGTIAFVPRPVVEVTVLDEATGQPVEGARVEVRTPKETETNRVTMRFGDVDDDEDGMILGEESSTGKTDAEGIALVDTTAGTTVEIAVDDGVHSPYVSEPILLPEVMTVYTHEVLLGPGGVLQIIAKDAAGRPGGGIPVEHKGDDPMRAYERRTQRTNSEGVLLMKGLAPGEHQVRLGARTRVNGVFAPTISIGGEVEDDGTWTTVEVVAGGKAVVQLLAPSLSSLSGEVTEAKAALVGARLKLRKKASSDLAGMLNLGGDPKMESTSDARGAFSFDDIEEGEYELVVEHATRSMKYVHPIKLDPGKNKLELDLDVTEIVGQVLDAEGKPVAGAKVKAEKAQEEGGRQVISMVMMGGDSGGGAVMFASGDESEPSVTDFEGRYRLRGVTPDIELNVKASAKGYDDAKSETLTVAKGSVKEGVKVKFAEPGNLRVEVEGGSGMMLAFVRRADAAPGTPPKVQPVKGGAAEFEGLAPGKVEVTIQLTDGDEFSVEPESRAVEIKAGETATATFEVE